MTGNRIVAERANGDKTLFPTSRKECKLHPCQPRDALDLTVQSQAIDGDTANRCRTMNCTVTPIEPKMLVPAVEPWVEEADDLLGYLIPAAQLIGFVEVACTASERQIGHIIRAKL